MTNDPEFINTLLKMVVFLLLMAGGAAAVLYFFKRVAKSTGHEAKQQLISVLSTKLIAPKKSVSLIHVPGAVLVVGIAGDTLSLLTKIEDRELVDEVLEYTPQPVFPVFLSRFRKTLSKDN